MTPLQAPDHSRFNFQGTSFASFEHAIPAQQKPVKHRAQTNPSTAQQAAAAEQPPFTVPDSLSPAQAPSMPSLTIYPKETPFRSECLSPVPSLKLITLEAPSSVQTCGYTTTFPCLTSSLPLSPKEPQSVGCMSIVLTKPTMMQSLPFLWHPW